MPASPLSSSRDVKNISHRSHKKCLTFFMPDAIVASVVIAKGA